MLNVLINFVFFVKLRWFLRERECFGRGLLDFCKSAFPQLVAAFAGVGFAFYFNWSYLKSQKKQTEIE